MNGEQQTPGAAAMAQDQARMELSMAAASAERANRPRGMVILAGLLLIGAVIYAVSGLMARAATLENVESARSRARELDAITDRIKALQLQQATRGLKADPRVSKAIEELAAAAGVKADAAGKPLVVPESEVTGIAVPGVTQKKYAAKVTGQDPKALLQWLVGVQSSGDTKGVEIFQLTLRPDASSAGVVSGGWSMDIEFVRWESR